MCKIFGSERLELNSDKGTIFVDTPIKKDGVFVFFHEDNKAVILSCFIKQLCYGQTVREAKIYSSGKEVSINFGDYSVVCPITEIINELGPHTTMENKIVRNSEHKNGFIFQGVK